jgi:hypothetical protein
LGALAICNGEFAERRTMAIKKKAKRASKVELNLKIRRTSRKDLEHVVLVLDNESDACGSGFLTKASNSVPPTKKVVFEGEIQNASDAHRIAFKNVRMASVPIRRAPKG